jgi:heme A synthase
VIHRHATIAALFGVAVIAVWLLRRHRGASQEALEPLMVLGVLLAAQGLVGSVQYELKLPTDIVWVHVALATLSWLAVLWSVADAGSLVPRTRPVESAESPGAMGSTGKPELAAR